MVFSFAVQGYSQNFCNYKEDEDKMLCELSRIACEIEFAIEVENHVLLQDRFENFYKLWIEILKNLYGFFNGMFVSIEEEAKETSNKSRMDAKKVLGDWVMQYLKETLDFHMRLMDNYSLRVKLFEHQNDLWTRIKYDDDDNDDEEDKGKGEFDGEGKDVGIYSIDDLDGLKERFEKMYTPWNNVVMMVGDYVKQLLGDDFAMQKKAFIHSMPWHVLTGILWRTFRKFNPKEQVKKNNREEFFEGEEVSSDDEYGEEEEEIEEFGFDEMVGIVDEMKVALKNKNLIRMEEMLKKLYMQFWKVKGDGQ